MPFTPLKHTIAKYRYFYQLSHLQDRICFSIISDPAPPRLPQHRRFLQVCTNTKVNAFLSAVCAVLNHPLAPAAGGSHLLHSAGFINHCIADSIHNIPCRVRAHRLSSGCPDLHASWDARTSGKRNEPDAILPLEI